MRHQSFEELRNYFGTIIMNYFLILVSCCNVAQSVWFAFSIFHFVRYETQLYICSYDSMIDAMLLNEL